MKYEAIYAHSPEHSVRKMCKVLGLKESGYYAWLKRREGSRERRLCQAELAAVVGGVFEENRRVYGYRKMTRALERKGCKLSEYKVRKIMRESGYYPIVVRKYRPTHNGKTDGKYCDNSLKQDFYTAERNKVWSGDITYIKTRLGYVYLATVIDLYNREVIGYEISRDIDTELVKAALGNAVAKNGGRCKGVIFHSDRGCQYSSKAYQTTLADYGITGSMSRPSCPYDNAPAESFFSSAKRECIYRKEYDNIEDVKRDMYEYIELFYNRKRMHASLGYMSPVEYRMANIA